jgi:hypothetical protein
LIFKEEEESMAKGSGFSPVHYGWRISGLKLRFFPKNLKSTNETPVHYQKKIKKILFQIRKNKIYID